MLSKLEFYISSGKYEIIEFGTRKSPFDVREKLEELEEENKRLKISYNTIVQDNVYTLELQQRIDKAINYINKFESIRAYFEYTDEDGYNEYDYETFRTELLKILKGEENE
jgi:archaellum component FlaC